MSTDASFRSKYGPCALVAGAAVGLGAEYSRQIAAHGLGLVLIDRDAGPLAATADAIRKEHGVDVRTLTVDLAGADVAERVLAGLGGAEIGLLVYNAAIGTVAPYLETTPALVEATIDVNCRGPLRLVHALVPAMVARGRGGADPDVVDVGQLRLGAARGLRRRPRRSPWCSAMRCGRSSERPASTS